MSPESRVVDPTQPGPAPLAGPADAGANSALAAKPGDSPESAPKAAASQPKNEQPPPPPPRAIPAAPPSRPETADEAEAAAANEPSSLLLLAFEAQPSWLVSGVVHLSLLLILALMATETVRMRASIGGPLVVTAGGEGEGELQELPPADVLSVDTTISKEAAQPQLPDPVQFAPQPVLPSLDLKPSLGLSSNSAASEPLTKGNHSGGEGVGNGEGSGLGDGAGPGSSLEARLDPVLRKRMLVEEGGSVQSESAVQLALAWLAQHQQSDGSWSFDHAHGNKCRSRCGDPGSLNRAKNAATALALLPFLGNGHTHKQEGQYRKTVDSGLYYLVRSMKTQGGAGSLHDPFGQMYGHGLGAIALCEAFGMTRDRVLEKNAQAAVNFIGYAQDPQGGGWRYMVQQTGDTSVVGWQLMALKSAHMAYLKVPQDVIPRVNYFLDSVQSEGGAVYGYMGPETFDVGQATTAIGLLCRMYLGWQKEHPALVQGVGLLSQRGPAIHRDKASQTDMYYNYYATQVLHHYGGPEWKRWNEELREYLIATQATEGHERGSWYFDPGDQGSASGGRLYCTAMSAMVLEVYYRHMPLYGARSIRENFFGRQ